MSKPFYLAITGGIGGAKLALGLSRLLASDELALVVNTGDDFEHLGLHISPDIDTLVYTLAGESNPELGWGRRGESWQFMAALEALGGETWFQLGDKDLAMHIERTRRLAAGQSLGQITADLAAALGIGHRIFPMTNDSVRTLVQTDRGEMDFQQYFVRDRCAPKVSGFEFRGSKDACFNPDIVDSLTSDWLAGVIVCPSNPFVSIDPILSIPGLREQLKSCPAPVIAVSPVVGGAAIKGPTVKMMRELKIPNTATGVARHYQDFLRGFILDSEDLSLQPEIEGLGLVCMVTNTVMQSLDDRVQLARACLKFIKQLQHAD